MTLSVWRAKVRWDTFSRAIDTRAAGIRYLPLYPPQVSLVFAPLAYLSYGCALALWWLCTAVIYGACCYAIWRECPNLRDFGGTVALVAIGAVNIVISLYYYLIVVKKIYVNPAKDSSLIPVPLPLKAVIMVTIAGVLMLGIYPGPVLGWTSSTI